MMSSPMMTSLHIIMSSTPTIAYEGDDPVNPDIGMYIANLVSYIATS